MADDSRYVLYIANSTRNPQELCPGSKIANALAENLPSVLIQKVETLVQQHTLPRWLDGTPLLVDTSNDAIHRGSAAVDVLRSTEQPSSSMVDAFEPSSVEPASVEQEFAGEGKITDDQLAKYIEKRNAALKQ